MPPSQIETDISRMGMSVLVPLKIQLDLQLTLMASALYRILGRRLGRETESARARTLFRKFVNASATVDITPKEIVVTIGRRANNPLLIAAGYAERQQTIPWLDNRQLKIRFL